jgi:curli biogenesis system outer membrane secretion channel CsgG
VLKRTIAVAAFVLAAAGSVAAQPVAAPASAQAMPAYQGTLAKCQVYEARMRRMAQISKGLGASYNTQHVMNECMADPSLADK